MTYSYDYWVDELVSIGRQIEPDKYTPQYIDYMRRQWRQVGITKLHEKVLDRKKQLNDSACIIQSQQANLCIG